MLPARTTRLVLIALALLAPGTHAQESPFERTIFRPFARLDAIEKEEPENPWEDEIRTDRDAFTPATQILGRRQWVFETSYSFIDNRQGAEKHSFPEILLRYGLTDWLELRVGWNHEIGGGANIASGQDVGESGLEVPGIVRESRFLYGIKAQVTRQSGWMPDSAAIVHGYRAVGEERTNTMSAGYVFGWELPNKWRWDTAIRFATAQEGPERFGEWAPSSVVRVPLSERWQTHVEYFGFFSAGRERDFARQFASMGAHFLVTPNLEIGVRIGFGLNEQSARFFSNVGLGWRF
jgi:hypothetical protein